MQVSHTISNGSAILLWVFATLLVAANIGWAQELQFEQVTIKHKRLPHQPLDRGINSFTNSLEVADSDLKPKELQDLRLDFLSVSGYEYNALSADISIELEVDEIRRNTQYVVDKTFTRMRGQDEITVPAYQYIFKYEYPYTLRVINTRDSSVLYEEKDNYEIKYKYPENEKVSSRNELDELYSEHSSIIKSNIRIVALIRLLRQSKNTIESLHGYPVMKLEINMGYVKKHKRHDYSDLYFAFQGMKQGLQQLEEDWYLDNMDDNPLHNSLKIFNRVKSEYKPGNKRSRITERVYFLVNHNAAICNFFIKNLSDCEADLADISRKAPYKVRANQKFLQHFVPEEEKRYMANQVNFQ